MGAQVVFHLVRVQKSKNNPCSHPIKSDKGFAGLMHRLECISTPGSKGHAESNTESFPMTRARRAKTYLPLIAEAVITVWRTVDDIIRPNASGI